MDTVKMRQLKRKIRSLEAGNKGYPSRKILTPEKIKINEKKIEKLKEELKFEYDRHNW